MQWQQKRLQAGNGHWVIFGAIAVRAAFCLAVERQKVRHKEALQFEVIEIPKGKV